MRLALAVAAALGCSAKDVFVEIDPDLNRMIEQPRGDPYERSTVFADGRLMRRPPAGTVATTAAVEDPERATGRRGDGYVERSPLPLDRAVLARGRDRFDIFCAPCHGVLGDGQSIVARNMPMVRPPSLHSERVRRQPPGRIYAVIREGFGLMGSYEAQLTIDERWAVVAYVRALQLAQAAPLATLAPALRREAEEALR